MDIKKKKKKLGIKKISISVGFINLSSLNLSSKLFPISTWLCILPDYLFLPDYPIIASNLMSETKILASLTNSLTCCYLGLFLWMDSKLNIISFLTLPLLPDPYSISLQDTWICSLTCLHLTGFFLSLVTSTQTSVSFSLCPSRSCLEWPDLIDVISHFKTLSVSSVSSN